MLILMDGFDHYATADILKKWNSGGAAIAPSSGRSGGGALSCTNANVTKTLIAGASWVMGCRVQVSAVSALSRGLFSLFDAATLQCDLRINPDLTLSVTRNGTALTGGTSTNSLSTGSYYYVEWKVTIADSIGANSCKVRVNGVDWITVATGQDTKNTANASANQLTLGPINAISGTWLIDDFYLCDSSGTTNNDFLGDIRVDTLYPNADGTYSQWTPSAVNGAHRYWRLYVDAVLSGSTIAIAELKLSLTPGGASVTTGGTASASNAAVSAASNAFDGSGGTRWATAPSQVPGWLAYDFGAGNTKDIRGFSIISENVAGYDSETPSRFQLQYSDDGVAWVTLAVATAANWLQAETRNFSADITATPHSALVDEATPNLTDYNYALTPGLRDSYAFQDLPSLVSSTVYGLQINAALLKDDAGNKQVALFARSGGADSDGATAALGTSQTYVSQIFETNGGAAWTQTSVNALEAGVKVVV